MIKIVVLGSNSSHNSNGAFINLSWVNVSFLRVHKIEEGLR